MQNIKPRISAFHTNYTTFQEKADINFINCLNGEMSCKAISFTFFFVLNSTLVTWIHSIIGYLS